ASCTRGSGGLDRPPRTHDFHSLRRVPLGRFVRFQLGWRLFGWRVFGWWWLVRWRRGVRKLVMPISKEDHAAIAAAIRSAEQRTSGQIVCVLMRSASEYYYVPVLWAALL